MTRLRVVTGEDTPDGPACPWQAALAAALADGAQRGVILYETEAGEMPGRQPVQAGRSTVRGLCLDTLDDLDIGRP